MRKLMVLMTTLCVGVGVVLASPPQPSKDPTAVNTIKQIEQDMGDAMVGADIDKLSQIYADDCAPRRREGVLMV